MLVECVCNVKHHVLLVVQGGGVGVAEAVGPNGGVGLTEGVGAEHLLAGGPAGAAL